MKRDDKTELLLSALLHDSLLFFEIVNRIDREIFVENEYNNFMHDLRRFYKRFKKMPVTLDFKTFTSVQNYPFAEFVFMHSPSLDREVARDAFYRRYQLQQTSQFLERTTDRILQTSSVEVDDLYEDVRKTVLSTKKPTNDFVELTGENSVQQYTEARDFRITQTAPTIFSGVNYLLQGGVAPGELEIFIAASNRGKTLYLVNEVINSMLHGEKCLYLSMENKAPSIISRMCDRILLMDKFKQRLNQPFCEMFIRRFFNFVKPPVILYQPANSFSVDDLYVWIDEYQNKNEIKFDRICVDYLNKMRKKKGRESWDEERRLTDDLRALGIAKDARIITAAQTSRKGTSVGKEDGADSIDESMIQGGFGQFETADIVLGYSETPQEKQRGTGRIVVLKARESGGRGREFVVSTAPWVGLMTDHAEKLLTPTWMHILENPDMKVGQLSGLSTKKEKKEGEEETSKYSRRPKADTEELPSTSRKPSTEPLEISGVTL